MKNNEEQIEYQVKKILYHFNRLKRLGGISKALTALKNEGFLNPILATTTNLTDGNNSTTTETLEIIPKTESTESKAKEKTREQEAEIKFLRWSLDKCLNEKHFINVELYKAKKEGKEEDINHLESLLDCNIKQIKETIKEIKDLGGEVSKALENIYG